MTTENKRIFLLIIGIILILIALIINNLEILRFILCLMGIILLTIGNSLERSHNKLFIPLFAFIITLFVIASDYLVVCAFKKLPIFTYSIVTNDTAKVYNGLGYRVWVCNNDDHDFKVDPLYKLGFYCSIKASTSEDINNVLKEINLNFDRYEGAYLKVTGRITNIIDNQTFTMQAYTKTDNNYEYDDTVTLNIYFNMPSSVLSNYNVNDEVLITGKIDSKETNNNKVTIKMIDSSFITSNAEDDSDDTYDFTVDNNIYCQYDKELWFETNNNIYYKSCVDDVNLKINDSEYNLMNALKNNLITLTDLENDANGYLSNSKDGSIIYTYNNFKMLVCDPQSSKDVILGKTDLSFDSGYCKVITDSSENGV